MKRWIYLLVPLAAATLLVSSCEDNVTTVQVTTNVIEVVEQPEEVVEAPIVADPFLFHKRGVILALNWSPVGGMADAGSDNFLHEIVTEDGRFLVLTAATIVFVQRESCSGFNPAVVGDVTVGDPIDYFYYMDNADFSRIPNRLTLDELWVYDTNCPLFELEDEDEHEDTDPCFNCWM